MAVQNHSFDFIQRALGKNISCQLLNRWMNLYHATCQVIQDPEGYEPQGQPEHLTEEEKLFMYNLVQSEPDLF